MDAQMDSTIPSHMQALIHDLEVRLRQAECLLQSRQWPLEDGRPLPVGTAEAATQTDLYCGGKEV